MWLNWMQGTETAVMLRVKVILTGRWQSRLTNRPGGNNLDTRAPTYGIVSQFGVSMETPR